MKYMLSLDQGTTSSRAILFQKDGSIAKVAQQEFKQHYPQSGWVEHCPNEIWQSQLSVIEKVLSDAAIQAHNIAAIGITNQRETTVVWNKETGEPISNAIVWQDRRTSGFCRQLKADGLETTFQQKTGLVLDPYFSGTKLNWLLNNVPDARKLAKAGKLAFGTIDSWLLWKLTGGTVHATDVTNASRTLLFNIHTLEWDAELLKILDIPESILPKVCTSSEVYGQATAIETLRDTPISGIAGDQQAALFGQTCYQPGMAKNTYGTGCFLLKNIGSKPIASQNKLLTTIAWKIGDTVEYALEGSVFVGGAVIQWLRDELKLVESAAQSESLAMSVPDNGGVYLVPAFTGLGAPHWDPFARGTLVGMTRGTNAAHITRAALESIAFQSADLLKAMNADSGIELNELRVDGGASMNDFLMQFQSDLLGVPVVRPHVTETTALGAAYLAGLAVNFWKDRTEIQKQWSIEQTFSPSIAADQLLATKARWQKAVTLAQGWES